MSREALVEAPMSMGRPAALAISLGLVLPVLATLAIDSIWPAPEPALLGQEAVEANRVRSRKQLADGSLFRWLELQQRHRSRARAFLAPYWTAVLLRTTGTASEDVIVGDDNWLFLRSRAILPDGSTESLIRPAVNLLATANRRARAGGCTLELVPIPRKSTICRELLPAGIPVRPEFDREAIDIMRSNGIEVVDLIDAWSDLDPREVFLSHDSHWAIAGQQAAARAVAAAMPQEFIGDLEASVVLRQANRAKAGNLAYLGVPYDHPARALVEPPPQMVARIVPASAAAKLRKFKGMSDVALIGTSFTASYDFRDLVGLEAKRPIAIGGYVAASFGEPLARLGLGVRSVPPPNTVFYEFPLSQLIDIHKRSGPAMQAWGTYILSWPAAPSGPVREAPEDCLRILSDHPRDLRVATRLGSVVSSGDGLVSLSVRASDAEGSRWRMRTGSLTANWTWPVGSQEVHLPIAEGATSKGFFELIALDDAARNASLEAELTSDLDLDELTWSTPVAPPTTELPPFGGILVRLEPTPGPPRPGIVTVTTQSGRLRRWHVEARSDALLVFSVGDLAGEKIESVEFEGSGRPKELAVAPPRW